MAENAMKIETRKKRNLIYFGGRKRQKNKKTLKLHMS